MKIKRKIKKLVILIILCISCFYFYNNFFVKEDDHIIMTKPSGNIDDNSSKEMSEEIINQLYDLSKEDERILIIIENKDTIPEILLEMLTRNLDLVDYVLSYNDYKGQVFADNIGDVKKGEYPLLLQYDKRWGYGYYGDNVIAVNGCGPTSLAMVIAGLTGRNDVTPYTVASDAYKNGYYDNGTKWSLFTEGVDKYNIEGEELSLSKARMINELMKKHPIIASMKPGDFTTTGHLIVITGIKDGKFVVNDPSSKERSEKLWSYEKIAPQIKNLWSFKRK